MTDYQPLLARALKGLDRNTSEARRAVYDRARQALLNQLRSAAPPSDAERAEYAGPHLSDYQRVLLETC